MTNNELLLQIIYRKKVFVNDKYIIIPFCSIIFYVFINYYSNMNENEFKISFGKKLKNIRKQKKLSQEYLAEKIGIEVHNWSRIETGKTFPRSATLVKILDVLDIEPAEMFEYTKSDENFDLKLKINKILDKNPSRVEDFYKILMALSR